MSKKKQPPAEPEAEPFSITLRDVEIPPLPEIDHTQSSEELVRSDPEARAEPYLGDPDADRTAQRAARRAEVRRERARDAAAADVPSAPEMLVLSADEAACSELCELLRAFGFGVQVMPAAPALPAPWPFVAVFVDATTATGDAIELCNQARESGRLPGEVKPVLLLVAQQLSATDRVRAGLAGCNEILLGAVTRGSVARVLEARGIKLPSDSRHA
jgi:hypothetical protein